MKRTYSLSTLFALCLLAWLLPSASIHAQATDVQLRISNGAAVDVWLADGDFLSLPQRSYSVEALLSLPVARMRLHKIQYPNTIGTAESIPLDTSLPPVEQGFHGTAFIATLRI